MLYSENNIFYMTSNLDNGKKPNEGETLKVAEAEQRDVGRKIARVDPEIVERLHIRTGDALELSSLGKKNNSSQLACKRKR